MNRLQLLVLLSIFINIAVAQKSTVDFRAGEVLVQTINNQSIEMIVSDISTYKSLNAAKSDFSSKAVAADLNIYKISFDSRLYDVQEVLSKINAHTKVRAAQLNYLVELRSAPNDPFYNKQWSMTKINAPSVWETTTGGLTACGDTIVIAVLDKGFDINHTDLKTNIWQNRLEIPNNGKDDDVNGYVDDYNGLNVTTGNDKHSIESHGTWCTGVIGAAGNNNVGVVGINWKIKMMILSGITDSEKILEAYNYILQQRKRYIRSNGKEGAYIAVTNMSLGFSGKRPADFPLICNIYNTLGQEGILNVVAADNVDNNINVTGDIPGLCPRDQLIVVTRTNDTDGLPRTAGYNATHVDLAAPGEGVLTTYLDNRYDVIGGNSFAAPLVAGSAALLYSIPQDSLCKLSKKQPLAALNIVKDAILRGVDIIPAVQGKTVTGGRLNIAKSFNRLRLLKGMPIGNLAITKVYPNPAQSQVNFGLRLPEAYQNITITISNTLGEIISERKIGNRDLFSEYIQLDTALYPSGIYLISLTSELFKISKKFVVAHR